MPEDHGRSDLPAVELLGGLTSRQFLERHWQKRPLLVRKACPAIDAPSRRQLLALARRPDVRSRRVVTPPDGSPRRVESGPFAEPDPQSLGRSPWTLLVQECDRHHRGCAELLDRFRFVPNWRIDDVMVSFATDGGGVGPHLDRYDVFLIQAAGRRRWRFASEPSLDERLEPEDAPARGQFRLDQEHVMEPGDLLYLPPRHAHDGVALGACVTCSVGFRVPDPRELCTSFLRQLSPGTFERIRYTDPDLGSGAPHGEIPPLARRRLREAARELFAVADFDRWVGCFVTRPLRGVHRNDDRSIRSAGDLESLLAGGGFLERSAPSHFAWFRSDDGAVQLFVGGEHYPLEPGGEGIAELLCGRRALDEVALRPLAGRVDLLIDLILRGHLIPVREASSRPASASE